MPIDDHDIEADRGLVYSVGIHCLLVDQRAQPYLARLSHPQAWSRRNGGSPFDATTLSNTLRLAMLPDATAYYGRHGGRGETGA